MRLGFVVNDLSGGGAEKALLLLLEHFVQQGRHELVLVTLEKGKQAYAVPEGIERTTLRSGRLNHGIGKIASLPLQAAELARHFREHGVDVGMSYLMRANAVNVLSRRFGNPAQIVISEHTYITSVTSAKDRLSRFLLKNTYGNADRVITVSRGIKESLIALGLPSERIDVAYNPIRLADIPDKPRDTNSRPIITTIGRLHPEKGHATLLHAFAALRKTHEASLEIAGVGPIRSELEAIMRELDLQEDVRFLGWTDTPYDILRRADLFVLSSRTEGFGIVVAEALGCGLPVISTRCAGPSEILQDGKWGLMVDVGDAKAMTQAMQRILTDKSLAQDLGTSAKERARDFDVSVIGARIETILSKVVDQVRR